MNRCLIILLLLAIVVGICIYFYFDPGDSAFFPRCPFLTVTGFQCPGCGSQRAIHALLHGDISGAWNKNALLVASLPFVGLLLFSEATRLRYPGLYRKVNSGIVIKICFVVVVAWWILRNVVNSH